MKTIGVFFGSRSPEHDVSIITAQLIISGLKKLGYAVVPVYLGKKGEWYVGGVMDSIKFFQQREKDFSGMKGYTLDLSCAGKMVFRKKSILKKTIAIDVAFPAFHGQNGEDGTIQGLFELCGVPYVGCDVPSSAMTMDKVLTLCMHKQLGFPVTPFVYFMKNEWEQNRDALMSRIHETLRWPLFVKPARLGSSIGMARVSHDTDLEFAIDVALHYDDKILIENGVEHCVDLTCAMLGNETPVPSLIQETVFKDSFLSYDDKYLTKGGTQTGKAHESIIIPARLDEKTSQEIRDMAVCAFKEFGCSGIARVDFLYNAKTKRFVIGEINTLPGTLYVHLWKASGIELSELLSRLLAYAQQRHDAKKDRTFSFDSDILQESNWSGKLRFLQGKDAS